MRCEDYPCCGHANDPDGCPDFETINSCKSCGRKFHPDNRCNENCPRCVAEWENDFFDNHGYYPGDR